MESLNIIEFIPPSVIDSYRRYGYAEPGGHPDFTDPQDIMSLYNYPKLDLIAALMDQSATNTGKEIQRLTSVFQKNNCKRVLDLASGAGRHVLGLADEGFTAIGADISMAQSFKSKLKDMGNHPKGGKAEFLNGDVNTLPIAENSIDGVFCMWSTIGEEPINYETVIPQVFHLLRPGGVFVIDNYNWAQKGGQSSSEHFTRERNIAGTNYEINSNVKTSFDTTRKLRYRTSQIDIENKNSNETDHVKYVCVTHTFDTDQWIEILKKYGFTDFEVVPIDRGGDSLPPEKMGEAIRIQISAKKPSLS